MNLSFVVASPEVTQSPIAWVGWSATVLGQLAEIGYGGVEVQVRDPATIDRTRLRTDLRTAGLAVAGVSTGPISGEDGLYLTAADDAVRKGAMQRLRAAVELGADLGTHVAIGGIRGMSTWAPDRATAMAWLRQGVEGVIERAAQLDVPVVLEPQSRHVTDIFNRIDQTIEFIKSIGSPLLGIEADSYHMALEERSVLAALVQVHRAGLLRHVQIGDSNRLAPGWGHLNWGDFFATLCALDYSGWVSVESAQIPDSRAAAGQGFRIASAFGAPCSES